MATFGTIIPKCCPWAAVVAAGDYKSLTGIIDFHSGVPHKKTVEPLH